MEVEIGDVLAALGVIFLVAVAAEITIETIRGLLSGVLRIPLIDEPFFKQQGDFRDAVQSVSDLFVEGDDNANRMVARLEVALERAKKNSKKRVDELDELVNAAKASPDADKISEISETVSRYLAEIDDAADKRAIVIKLLAGLVALGYCVVGEIDALSLLNFEAGSVEGEPNFSYGILLTGIAAAGGSTFWHDQIERVRLLRSSVALVAPTPRQAPAGS